MNKHDNMTVGTLSCTAIDTEIERMKNLPSRLSKEEILSNRDRGFAAIVDMIEDQNTENDNKL